MEYFAGANTRSGFVSLFDDAFSDVKRLYILKGSSGCGKSTFMKRIAGKAQRLGYKVDLIYCSGDPDSIDGVIVPQIGKAVADGTNPHSLDTKYPCVRESIINLGDFWDEGTLLPHRDEIIRLTDSKSVHYKNAYRILSTLGDTLDIKRSLISQCTDKQKLDRAAIRLVDKLTEARGGIRSIFASAFTFSGIKTIPVFGEVDRLIEVKGKCTEAFMTAVERIVRERGAEAVISRSPIDASISDAVYFPSSSTLISSCNVSPCTFAKEKKSVITSRFTDNGALQSVKLKLHGIERFSSELLIEAQKELLKAREAHSEIERIYIPSMDFAALDEFTVSFTERFFAE